MALLSPGEVFNAGPIARRTHDAISDVTTSADQNTGTGDVTRKVRTGPTHDVTRASSSDDIGDGAGRQRRRKQSRAPEFVGVRYRKKDHNEVGTT